MCVIVTPLPPGRPGSSRYQGASCVTLVSRKGWPLGRGLLAGARSAGMCYSRIKKAPDCDFFYAAPTPLCVRAVPPLPPGRPGSSRYQGASCVTLVSRKGWPLGRGLLAGVVSPLWLLYFRPAAACLRAPLMGLLSGRAPVCACLRPPAKLVALRYCRITSRLAKSRPPAAADCRKTQVMRSFRGRTGLRVVGGVCACLRRPWFVPSRLWPLCLSAAVVFFPHPPPRFGSLSASVRVRWVLCSPDLSFGVLPPCQ